MMQTENRSCQNCKSQFTIEPEDFEFYEKIKVPPPTWCPECRMIRRMCFRNERALYHRKCDMCGKQTISMYAPNKKYTVYCVECYQSDKWDPLSYSREYDFSKSFFEQFNELLKIVPRRTLYQDFAINSPYTNWAVRMKNSYLVFGGTEYEDSHYCASNFSLVNCTDLDFSKKCEACYESIHLRDCNKMRFSSFTENCIDSWFLNNCKNCQNCVGCVNLRNETHCILNRKHSKDEYAKRLEELKLNTREGLEAFRKTFEEHRLKYPHKFAYTRNVVNSTGDDLDRTENCVYCFSAYEDENCRYSFFMPTGAKDCYDVEHTGMGAELAYEIMSSFGTNRCLFGTRVYYSHDVLYSDDCYNSSNLFGCIGIRKKEYCILNKQYPKEEYEILSAKIKHHMDEIPYQGNSERVYKFGEFFPIEISPFAYNETNAEEYFPLTKEQALANGYAWQDPEPKNYTATKNPEELPDIKDVSESIIQEVISCGHKGACNDGCTTAFKIIPTELQFYKALNVPLPVLCSNCRHADRLRIRNPLRLYRRKCECAGAESESRVYKNTVSHERHSTGPCPNIFQTSYSPERPEIVYCEQCYNAEVV